MSKNILDLITKPIDYKIQFGNIINASKIMVLSPHHDDEVIGCGGTILKYLEIGAEVLIVYLTDGRYGTSKDEIHLRKEEAKDVWRDYKNVTQEFFDFEDTRLSEFKPDAVNKLKILIEQFQPEIIFTPWILDLHRDHKSTTLILSEVLEENNNKDLITFSYEVMCPLYSNHSVNITKHYDRKTQFIDLYKSQHTYLNIKETTKAINLFRASLFRLKAIKYAEGFFVAGCFEFCDLISQIARKKV